MIVNVNSSHQYVRHLFRNFTTCINVTDFKINSQLYNTVLAEAVK